MKFDDRSIDWLAELLADAARTEIMPRFRRLGEGDVRQKTSAADLVTEADVNAERLITARLRERYPDAMVVGEETCSDDPALLSGLGDAAHSRRHLLRAALTRPLAGQLAVLLASLLIAITWWHLDANGIVCLAAVELACAGFGVAVTFMILGNREPSSAGWAALLIAGFTLIDVPSYEAALEWVKQWPPLDGHGNVQLELRQVITAEDFGEAFTPELQAREQAMRDKVGS